MRLAHDSRTPLVSWRFLGISELSLALFPQEQPCRNPQQQIQCGCTQAKLDVPEETRSRVKSAFIPQKRHDLGTIWDKSQIFSNIWVQPAYKDHSREKHLSCAWYWEAKNKSKWEKKAFPPCLGSTAAEAANPSTERVQMEAQRVCARCGCSASNRHRMAASDKALISEPRS